MNIKICKLRAFHVTVATPPDLANAILESLNLPVEPPAKTKPLEISQSSRLRKQASVEPPAVDISVEQDVDAETVAAQAPVPVATKKVTGKTLVHVAKKKVTNKSAETPRKATGKKRAAPPDRTPKYKASRLDKYVASEDW